MPARVRWIFASSLPLVLSTHSHPEQHHDPSLRDTSLPQVDGELSIASRTPTSSDVTDHFVVDESDFTTTHTVEFDSSFLSVVDEAPAASESTTRRGPEVVDRSSGHEVEDRSSSAVRRGHEDPRPRSSHVLSHGRISPSSVRSSSSEYRIAEDVVTILRGEERTGAWSKSSVNRGAGAVVVEIDHYGEPILSGGAVPPPRQGMQPAESDSRIISTSDGTGISRSVSAAQPTSGGDTTMKSQQEISTASSAGQAIWSFLSIGAGSTGEAIWSFFKGNHKIRDPAMPAIGIRKMRFAC